MIFIRGARQLVTLRGPDPPRRGMQLSDLGVISDGALLIDGGEIRQVGMTRRVENLAEARSAKVIDATGKVILPGFADSQTRLIQAALNGSFGNFGTNPLEQPMASLSSTLRSTAPKTLQMRLRNWAQMLVSHGTTTFEVGTGSGLDLPSEIKGLQAARALHGHPLDVTCAFLAGRPESDATGRTPAEVEQVTEVLLPIIRRRRLADFCAVECGPEAFDAEQSRQILEAAKQLRFGLRLVADPQAQSGIASLAVEMRALTIENPGSLEDEEADLLARSATVVTYLPAAVYASGSGAYPPARELIDRGAAVALATGFGPASPTLSMPMVLSLACREMGFSPEEAITAATLNGAAALGRAHLQGSLEPGKQADLAMFEVRDYREIPYYFGFNPCVMTMKKGRVLYEGCGSSHG